MSDTQIIDWLLQGDVAIAYQTYRDLLLEERSDLQQRISREGFGALLLAKRRSNGHWGDRFYQPKWISTHYTLLDFRNLCPDRYNGIAQDAIMQVLNDGKASDGGIPLGPSTSVHSDVCVNAMFLNYAAYFQSDSNQLQSIVDSILNAEMPDHGYNCRYNRGGAVHSSLHTTLSVLEGLSSYIEAHYSYRKAEIIAAIENAKAFILLHQFFKSDKTGAIIDKKFLKLAYPRRWRYDILSALDYFQYANTPFDERMMPAITVLLKKRRKDGTWNLQAKHPGKTHFDMENAGQPSRWNTLRALRVLKYYNMC